MECRRRSCCGCERCKWSSGSCARHGLFSGCLTESEGQLGKRGRPQSQARGSQGKSKQKNVVMMQPTRAVMPAVGAAPDLMTPRTYRRNYFKAIKMLVQCSKLAARRYVCGSSPLDHHRIPRIPQTKHARNHTDACSCYARRMEAYSVADAHMCLFHDSRPRRRQPVQPSRRRRSPPPRQQRHPPWQRGQQMPGRRMPPRCRRHRRSHSGRRRCGWTLRGGKSMSLESWSSGRQRAPPL